MNIFENLDINNLENEVWKVITDFPDYYVSNLGRIKSFKYDRINGKILKQNKNSTEYFVVRLSKNGKKKTKKVHILVFETFNNYKLKDDECVHHIDFINLLPEISKENNTLENLEMMTKKEHNRFHNKGKHPSEETRKKLSESQKGEKNHNFGKGISNQKIIDIRIDIEKGDLTQVKIAKKHGVANSTVSKIKKGVL
jgi:hypothetical protein